MGYDRKDAAEGERNKSWKERGKEGMKEGRSKSLIPEKRSLNRGENMPVFFFFFFFFSPFGTM